MIQVIFFKWNAYVIHWYLYISIDLCFYKILGEHDERECYVCLNSFKGENRRKRRHKQYVGTKFVQLTLPHSDSVPIPKPPSPDVAGFSSNIPDFTSTIDPNYEPPEASDRIILISQDWMDETIKKMNLSKRDSEYLARRLKRNNLLEHDVRITGYRNRQAVLQKLFTVNAENTFVYCNDINKLMQEMNINYVPNKWRLFIDSSKSSLKAVLLYYYNKKPSVPIAYNTNTKETYDSVRDLLQVVDYRSHQWRICCDLKMVSLVCGLQGGYTKHMCFLSMEHTV